MKKIVLTAAILAIGFSATAQNWEDGLRFSENEYEGTARTMAMGNAFTALGGDMGSLGINPAGSAVARRSQFTVTPGMNISIARVQGEVLNDGSVAFGNKLQNDKSRFSMPNIGGMINFNTGRSRGLKNWSMGFVVNNTRSYSEEIVARGLNTRTSAFGEMAARAQYLYGYKPDDFNGNDAYDKIIFADYDLVNAFRAGAIAGTSFTTGGKTEDAFVGATENSTADGRIGIGAHGLNQHFGQTISGAKSDFVYNLALNISDIFFFGANIGVTSINYRSNEFLKEDAVDIEDVTADFGASGKTYFSSAKKTYSYRAEGTGVYGKFGFILTPWKGLRVGAAIQTPTTFTIKERISYSCETMFEDSKFSGSDTAPEGKFEYNFKAPLRANFGVAYTFGKYGVVSADYELSNYRRMYFSVPGTSDNSEFDSANNGILDYCGVQHYLRFGAEFKPADFFSVRLGYNLKTTGQTYEADGSGNLVKAPAQNLHTASCGFGFSAGAFFADLAAVGYFYPTQYIMPYGDYRYEKDTHRSLTTESPVIRYRRNLVKVVATFGVRF